MKASSIKKELLLQKKFKSMKNIKFYILVLFFLVSCKSDEVLFNLTTEVSPSDSGSITPKSGSVWLGDQIKLNYDLMQLKDVDISGDAKMKIMHIAQDEITKMDVLAFKKMFMVDKMYTVIKDLDTWLTSAFNPLNAYRSL